MLYDNALLLGAYAEAAAATGEPLFARIALRTAEWMRAEMRAPGGAFYSSLDADADGSEGSYYVWDAAAVRQALSGDEYAAFSARLGLDMPPNFEGHAHHLIVATRVEAIAATLGTANAAVESLLDSACSKLLALRAARVRPERDEKILTSWNALAIHGLATAARLLDRDELADHAAAALAFLRQHHWRDGRLYASSAGGDAQLPAYLDDHVFLAAAILELASVRFDAGELQFGRTLLDTVLANFADDERGGFYFTAAGHEALISRPKSFGDEALPAGNGIAAVTLQRYGFLLGETRYLVAAERTLRAAWAPLREYPPGHASLLQALEEWLEPPTTVILRGPLDVIEPWRRELAVAYSPRRLVLAVPGDGGSANSTAPSPGLLPPSLADKPATAGGAAYVCRGNHCSAALGGLAELLAELAHG